MQYNTESVIGASLSESHTSVTSLHPWVCMFACLDRPLTVNHFWLIFYVVMSYFKFKDNSIVQLLDGDDKDGEDSWNYSVSRGIT